MSSPNSELFLLYLIGNASLCLCVLELQISNLAQIFLIGFYEEKEFALYVSSISNELKIPVR